MTTPTDTTPTATPDWRAVEAAAYRVIDACHGGLDVTPTILGSEIARLLRSAGIHTPIRPAPRPSHAVTDLYTDLVRAASYARDEAGSSEPRLTSLTAALMADYLIARGWPATHMNTPPRPRAWHQLTEQEGGPPNERYTGRGPLGDTVAPDAAADVQCRCAHRAGQHAATGRCLIAACGCAAVRP